MLNRTKEQIVALVRRNWKTYAKNGEDNVVLVVGIVFEENPYGGVKKFRIMIFPEEDLKVCKMRLDQGLGPGGEDAEELKKTGQHVQSDAPDFLSYENLNNSFGKRKSRWDNVV